MTVKLAAIHEMPAASTKKENFVMPTADEVKNLAKELHSKKLIDLDAPLNRFLDVQELRVLDQKDLPPGAQPDLWNVLFGSGYVLITNGE